jgi:arylsulfatase
MGHRTFKVHLDGKNLLPFFKGDVAESPRKGFLYWSDDGEVMAIRAENWKVCFKEQRAKGLDVWREPLADMRVPKIFHLRADPFERGDESLLYGKWMFDRAFALVPAQTLVGEWLASFSLDRIMDSMTRAA